MDELELSVMNQLARDVKRVFPDAKCMPVLLSCWQIVDTASNTKLSHGCSSPRKAWGDAWTYIEANHAA